MSKPRFVQLRDLPETITCEPNKDYEQATLDVLNHIFPNDVFEKVKNAREPGADISMNRDLLFIEVKGQSTDSCFRLYGSDVSVHRELGTVYRNFIDTVNNKVPDFLIELLPTCYEKIKKGYERYDNDLTKVVTTGCHNKTLSSWTTQEEICEIANFIIQHYDWFDERTVLEAQYLLAKVRFSVKSPFVFHNQYCGDHNKIRVYQTADLNRVLTARFSYTGAWAKQLGYCMILENILFPLTLEEVKRLVYEHIEQRTCR